MRLRPTGNAAAASVVPPIAAWLLAIAFGLVKRQLWLGGNYYPTLPLVSLPFDPRRDIVSSIPALFLVLVASAFCSAVVEISKFSVAKRGRPGVLAYLILTIFQIALIADMLRTYAHDWWIWSLSWLGLRTLTETPNPQVGGISPIPWISGLLLATTVLYLTIFLRRLPGRAESSEQNGPAAPPAYS